MYDIWTEISLNIVPNDDNNDNNRPTALGWVPEPGFTKNNDIWRHYVSTSCGIYGIYFQAVIENLIHDDVIKWTHFRVTGHLCGEFTGVQRPVTRNFDVFFDLRLNKRLRKQSWCWWLETLSRPLWRHCNAK